MSVCVDCTHPSVLPCRKLVARPLGWGHARSPDPAACLGGCDGFVTPCPSPEGSWSRGRAAFGGKGEMGCGASAACEKSGCCRALPPAPGWAGAVPTRSGCAAGRREPLFSGWKRLRLQHRCQAEDLRGISGLSAARRAAMPGRPGCRSGQVHLKPQAWLTPSRAALLSSRSCPFV